VKGRPFTTLSRMAAWAVFTIVGASQARAQGTRVESIVHDSSGASVVGAQVELRAQSYLATAPTDSTGVFAFDHVLQLSGTIAVSAKGFQPVNKQWTAAACNTVQAAALFIAGADPPLLSDPAENALQCPLPQSNELTATL
jgi:hypothetical protein